MLRQGSAQFFVKTLKAAPMKRSCLIVLLVLVGSHLRAEVAVPLRAGDVFELHLAGMPQDLAAEFAYAYTVAQDGTVNVPMIGEMKAAGLTSSQLERAIQAKFVADKVFTHPTVLISVAQAARVVYFTGGLRTPGHVTWTPDLTLSRGVGECGGVSDFSHDGIRVIRDGKVAGTFKLKEIAKNPGLDPKLMPGDQVIVPE
jgi:polysaccharide export outer membrane protein